MNPLRQYRLKTFVALCLLSLSCKENSTEIPNQFEIGKFDIAVTGIQYDEFQRAVPFQGTASLILVSASHSFYGTLSATEPVFTFKKMPASNVILKGEKSGFFPYESSYFTSVAKFFPYPSSDFCIDSIQAQPSNYFDEIKIRMVAHRSIPENGSLIVSCFFGLDSTVSSKPGTYFGVQSSGGSGTNVISGAFYKFQYVFPPGTKIFVTARIHTGATKYFYDTVTKIPIVTNLEENTTVITSFTY